MKAPTSCERPLFFPPFPRFRANAVARICKADYSRADLNLYCENQRTESRLTTDNISRKLERLGVFSSSLMGPSTPSFLRSKIQMPQNITARVSEVVP